ncbi:MAG: DUF6069 family protein [Nocardioidaceae bacterium]
MTQNTQTQGTTERPGGPALTRPVGELLVAAAAVAAAVLVWALAAPLGGVALTVGTGASAQEIGPAAVVVVSLLAAGCGAAALRLLQRLSPRGRRTWTVVATVVLVVSLVGPTGAASAAAWAVLTCMHLAVGSVVVLGLRQVGDDR